MPDVLTAVELSKLLIDTSRAIDECVFEYERSAKIYAEALSQSEYMQATFYPKTEGTVPERDHQLKLECNSIMFQEYLADARKASADRAFKAAMAKLSAYMTLSAALREELKLARVNNFEGP